MKKLSVTLEIAFLIVTMSLIGTGVGIFGINQMSKSDAILNSIFDNALVPYHNLKAICNIYGSTIIIDIEKLANQQGNLNTSRASLEENLIKAEALVNNFQPDQNYPEEIIQYERTKQQTQKFTKEVEHWLNQLNTTNNTSYNTSDIWKTIHPLKAELDKLMQIQVKKGRELKVINKDNLAESKIYFSIILAIGILVSMALAFFILVKIKVSLASTSKLILKIASGNLSTKIERRGGKDFGELHENLRLLSDRFTEILGISQAAASNISITSQELSSNSQMISSGANQQAAAVEEIAASMQQISQRVQKNTDNTLVTQKISTKVVSGIKTSSENTKQTSEAIQSITEKISIVGDIAFQTNILALNAAVEAARAGEHGKGFGAVAAAVGKLAERSKAAALEIDSLSQSGVDLAKESHKSLSQFVSEITTASNLISQITNANLQQNNDISDVNSAVQMLNQITQQNAAASEEMTTVSEEMAAQAQMLKESIQYFKFQKENEPSSQEQKYLNPANRK